MTRFTFFIEPIYQNSWEVGITSNSKPHSKFAESNKAILQILFRKCGFKFAIAPKGEEERKWREGQIKVRARRWGKFLEKIVRESEKFVINRRLEKNCFSLIQ